MTLRSRLTRRRVPFIPLPSRCPELRREPRNTKGDRHRGGDARGGAGEGVQDGKEDDAVGIARAMCWRPFASRSDSGPYRDEGVGGTRGYRPTGIRIKRVPWRRSRSSRGASACSSLQPPASLLCAGLRPITSIRPRHCTPLTQAPLAVRACHAVALRAEGPDSDVALTLLLAFGFVYYSCLAIFVYFCLVP